MTIAKCILEFKRDLAQTTGNTEDIIINLPNSLYERFAMEMLSMTAFNRYEGVATKPLEISFGAVLIRPIATREEV